MIGQKTSAPLWKPQLPKRVQGMLIHFHWLTAMGCNLLSAELNTAFPSHFSRSFATKENTYRWLLKVLCDCGMMAEVASDAEISMLIAAGFPADRTVYDAPTKKRSELERILLLGCMSMSIILRNSKWSLSCCRSVHRVAALACG